MNMTEAFIKHVETLTSHSESYTRGLLNSKYWVVIENNGIMFLSFTWKEFPEDEVAFTGTHQECVQYLVSQFEKGVENDN
jgi:hypothetical protein